MKCGPHNPINNYRVGKLTETLVLEQIVQRMPRGNCSS